MDQDNKEKLSPVDAENESVSQSQAELAVKENKVKIISPGRMVMKRFFRSKLSVIGLVTLIILFSFAIFGPLFSNYGETDPDLRMTPPVLMDYEITYTKTVESNESVFEIAEQCLAGDYIPLRSDDTPEDIAQKVKQNKEGLYEKYRGRQGSFTHDGETYWFEMEKSPGMITIFLLDRTETEVDGKPVVSFARRITKIVRRTASPRILNINAYPTADHWLGTDASGYDVFTRLMYGGRISLMLSFIVIFIEMILGIIFGGLAGYFGKWVDLIIMRVIDILNCLPGIPLMLIFSSILDGMEVDQSVRIFFLMGMISLLGWTGIARTVRGQILMLREQEFMVAAEALGLSVPRRIIKHLIPNVMPLLIVGMTLGLGSVILSEATLSFLGLGIRPPYAAWGTMINTANEPITLQYFPNQWVPAGVMIVLVVLAFNFVGDGLRDAFDPKARR